MSGRRLRLNRGVVLLLVSCALPLVGQELRNPGIFQQYSVPPSSTLGFYASEAGKQ